MRLSDLDKWGIPERIIEIWQKRQGESLLPVQSRAVRKGLLGEKEDGFEYRPVRMLVSAPTSSGKSFCAEMALVKALTHRRKTVILVPLKSLAEHRHCLLQETYGELGVNCLIATGDHPENDRRFAGGDYQIAVAIYEKFDLLLTRLGGLDALKNIGLVVVDEIQTIADPERGAILERLLTKIQASVYTPSMIGLSAVIGDSVTSAGRLAEWLGATLVEETARPVDLVRGVAAEGSFRYRSYNSGIDGSEPFVEIKAADESFDGFIQQVKSNGGSTLVFLKSRRETVDCAFRLAAAVGWPEAKRALEQLSEEEPSFLVRSLRQALTRGVAFHNADLSPRQRSIVEQAFIDREVKVIFSTTTLALGVDLPADTVYLETVKYSSGEYGSRPTLVPVSRAEFDNMTGRAGRLRDGNNKPGRAIVLAESDFDREILWENYIAPDRPEPMKSAFNSMPLEDWLLNMIVSGLASDRLSLEALFATTFYSSQNAEQKAPDFDTSLTVLLKHHLIALDKSRSATGGSATALGQAAAKAGLSVAQTRHLLDKLALCYPQTMPGWTALALSAPGWSLPAGILTGFELSHNFPARLLYQHFDHLLEEAGILLGDSYRREPLSYLSAAKLKAFLLLHDWSRLAPVQALEECFQMHLGQIITLAETAAHLVGGLALLIEATDRETPVREQLGEHAFSLRFGMPHSLQELQAHFGEILHRGDFAALHKAGVESLADLGALSGEQMEKIIPVRSRAFDRTGENKIKLLNEKLETLQEEVAMQSHAMTSDTQMRTKMALSAQPESVEIDGAYERERYLVKINGFPVRLTGKSFKYFTKLAWSRLNREAGWMYKEDIEVGFNQARYLYRMKNEITAALSLPWPVIENNRLGYYRLSVDPAKIHFNFDNLKTHPDYELSSLAGESNTEPVN